MLAGIPDMMFQIFLFANIDGSGLASTVPIQVGSDTVFGAILTLIIDRRAKLQFYIPGLIINCIAILLNAVTYRSLHNENVARDKEALVPQNDYHSKFSATKMILIALVGAICGVPFGPGTALGGKEPHALNPYVDASSLVDR